VASVKETTGLASHASVAVAVGKDGKEEQSMLPPTVGQTITGAVLSVTLMVRLQEDALPQASVAV